VTHFSLAPELVWGLLSRGLALIYFISFASMANQVLVMAGTRGYSPMRDRLARMRRDFPSWRRFAYFPTLSWIVNSDAALGSFAWIGLFAAGAAFFGGPFSRMAFVVCYLLYLTLDRVLYLMFPWDSMMFEAGVFAMFLPPLQLLPNVAAVVGPDPALAWVYRLLLFRVLLGFGKFKFLGSTRQDTGYLKGFLINQPLPSPIAWFMQKLPMWSLKLALYFMFIVEVPLPFAVFMPRISYVAALAIDLLMLVIWLCGTFGYFSLIMMVVSLSWLDSQTALAFSFAHFFSLDGPLLLHALILLHTIGAALSFPFNSYCTMTWLNWPVWTRIRPRFLTAPITLYRVLHPFRWLHAYGVFPPKPSPPVKVAPVMEVTWDGQEWHELSHHFSPTHELSPPRFCAPHHARLDQALIYDVFGLSDATVLRNLVGVWDPYAHVHAGGSWHMMRRAVEGWMPSLAFNPKTIPAKSGAPLAARVRSYILEPTTIAELRASGRWWKRTLMGPHSGPVTRDGGFGEHAWPPPELWHFDDRIWLGRSSLGKLMRRAQRGENIHELVLVDADGFTAADVACFWDDFLPSVESKRDQDWSGLRALVTELRGKYGRQQLYQLERIAGRYGALLLARLEPLFLERGLTPAFGKVKPTLDAKTHYHLGLLTRHILTEGRAAYDAVAETPAQANEYLAKMTMQSGAYLLALFRYEIYVNQSQKLRLMTRWLDLDGRPPPTATQAKSAARIDSILRRILGPLDMVDFLKTQFARPEESLDTAENWPRFGLSASGTFVRVSTATDPEPVRKSVEMA
jgi:lipase maturation factor